MDTTIVCQVCREKNDMTQDKCANATCQAQLPDAQRKLMILLARAKRLSSSTSTDTTNPVGRYEIDTLRTRVLELEKQLNATRELLQASQNAREATFTLQNIPFIAPSQFTATRKLSTSENFQCDLGELVIAREYGQERKLQVVRKTLTPKKITEENLNRIKDCIAFTHKLGGGDGTIIKLLGATGLDKVSRNPVVYYPYYCRGDLRSFLASNSREMIPMTTRVFIAYSIIKALSKVHQLDRLHRDVNSFHVFIDSDNTVVLAGMSQARFKTNMTMTNGVGDILWVAPETIKDGSRYTEKADIYSLAMVLIEIMTQEVPYSHQNTKSKYQLWEDIANATEGDEVMLHNHDNGSPLWYQEITKKCALVNPNARPSIFDVLAEFEKGLIDNSSSFKHPTGALNVQLIIRRAYNLYQDSTTKVDAYCFFQHASGRKTTSVNEEQGANPVWNETFAYEMDDLTRQTLEIIIFRQTPTKTNPDTRLGKCTFNLHEVLDSVNEHGQQTLELPIYLGSTQHGSLIIHIKLDDNYEQWRNSKVELERLLRKLTRG